MVQAAVSPSLERRVRQLQRFNSSVCSCNHIAAYSCVKQLLSVHMLLLVLPWLLKHRVLFFGSPFARRSRSLLGTNPSYELRIESTDRVLLSARRRAKNQCSSYLISLKEQAAGEVSADSEDAIAKVGGRFADWPAVCTFVWQLLK